MSLSGAQSGMRYGTPVVTDVNVTGVPSFDPYGGGFTGNFYLDVSRGLIENVTSKHLFGVAEDVDTGDGVVDIWDGTAIDLVIPKITNYTYSTIADIELVNSSDPTDYQQVFISGLDVNGVLVDQTVNLTGQIPVVLATPLYRIFDVHNDNGTLFQGNIFVCTTDQTYSGGLPVYPARVRSVVHPENQQSANSMWTVPFDSTLQVTHGWANIGKQNITEVVVTIWTRPLGSVFRKLHTLSLQTSGSSGDHRPYEVPLTLSAGTDIVYRVQSFTNNTSVSAGLHGILFRDPDSLIAQPPSISSVDYYLQDGQSNQLVDALGNPLFNAGV